MDIAFSGKMRLDTPTISVRDRSFLLGDGCFETLRISDGKAEGVDEHLALLHRSAEMLSITGLPVDTVLKTAIAELVTKAGADASLRITLSRGAGGRGADAGDSPPVTVISLFPGAGPRPLAPLNAITSSILRNDTSPISQIKPTNYADNLAARREAVEAGADEALLLNTKGRPACFAMANLFLVLADGTWVTPPPSEGIRAGYMRARTLGSLTSRQHPLAIRPIEPEELTEPGGRLFASNSLWGLRPVARLDLHTYKISMAPFDA